MNDSSIDGIRRIQYRCSFKPEAKGTVFEEAMAECRERIIGLTKAGRFCNVSFYRHEDMGFLYMEEILKGDGAFLKTAGAEGNTAAPDTDGSAEKTADSVMAETEDTDILMAELTDFLKSWPEEAGDRFFVPMVNVYYHHVPDTDLDEWERERTSADKTRVGRIAFLFPDKLPSYVMYHTAIVQEGLLKGDKYQFISLHENILFSYYEEPRNNVNLKGTDEESKVIGDWLSVDPESHFDRIKAQGSNFLVIPCLFSVDRVDIL